MGPPSLPCTFRRWSDRQMEDGTVYEKGCSEAPNNICRWSIGMRCHVRSNHNLGGRICKRGSYYVFVTSRFVFNHLFVGVIWCGLSDSDLNTSDWDINVKEMQTRDGYPFDLSYPFARFISSNYDDHPKRAVVFLDFQMLCDTRCSWTGKFIHTPECYANPSLLFRGRRRQVRALRIIIIISEHFDWHVH